MGVRRGERPILSGWPLSLLFWTCYFTTCHFSPCGEREGESDRTVPLIAGELVFAQAQPVHEDFPVMLAYRGGQAGGIGGGLTELDGGAYHTHFALRILGLDDHVAGQDLGILHYLGKHP